jgi:hypothetical protein
MNLGMAGRWKCRCTHELTPQTSPVTRCQCLLAGYTYEPWNGRLVVDAAVRINVQGWDSGGSLNTAARSILGK